MQRRRGLWRAATSEPRIEQAQNSRPESAHTQSRKSGEEEATREFTEEGRKEARQSLQELT